MNTLNFFFRFIQLRFRYPTNTLRPTLRILPLNASQAAQILVPSPLPLGDEVGISDSLLQTPLVQFSVDGGSFVEEVENVTGTLVVDLEDGPSTFDYSFTLVTCVFSYKFKEKKL